MERPAEVSAAPDIPAQRSPATDGRPPAPVPAPLPGKASRPDPDPAPAGGPWRRALLAGGLVWLASHIGYLAITLMSRMSSTEWVGLQTAMRQWQQSDTNWYLIIAENGYAPGPSTQDDHVTAFLPLYPMLIRLVDPVLPGGGLVAALVVSNAALFGALAVLHRLVEHEFDAAAARRAVWYLMLFPTAFFLVAGYPTGLFLLLVAGAVYAIRREHWWAAGLLGGLATATRQSAMLLVLVFAYEYARRNDWRFWRVRWNALAVLLIPTGLLAYMAHLAAVRGDAFAFMRAQDQWLREGAPPWDGLIRSVKVFFRIPLVTNQVNTLELLTVLFLFALLLISVVGPGRLRRDQWVLPLFGAVLLLFYLSYPTTKPLQPLMSISRFGLEVFPAFAMLGRLGGNPFLDRTYTFVALGVQPILIVHFLHGGWVA